MVGPHHDAQVQSTNHNSAWVGIRPIRGVGLDLSHEFQPVHGSVLHPVGSVHRHLVIDSSPVRMGVHAPAQEHHHGSGLLRFRALCKHLQPHSARFNQSQLHQPLDHSIWG